MHRQQAVANTNGPFLSQVLCDSGDEIGWYVRVPSRRTTIRG